MGIIRQVAERPSRPEGIGLEKLVGIIRRALGPLDAPFFLRMLQLLASVIQAREGVCIRQHSM